MPKAKYIDVISHDTSVKTLSVIGHPTNRFPGLGDFGYEQGVFSVFDYGTITPTPRLDNSAICLQAGYNFEMLKDEGLNTHYLGLVTPEGEPISARDAVKRKIAPQTMRMNLVNRLKPTFNEEKGQWNYSAFHDGETQCCVHPIEFMSRNALPESSSVWKRVARGEITLQDLGLPEGFQQGDPIPEHIKPILDYSTKFEPDDRYLSPAEAQKILGVDDERFATINESTRRASNLMTDYAASRGFKREDGKVEYATYIQDGSPIDVLADAVTTWHEDRLVHEGSGIGISKQRIRDKMKKVNPQWYEEIERSKAQAKSEGHEDFRHLMNPSIGFELPPEEFFTAVNTLFQAATNQWVGAKVYPVYASRRQSMQNDLNRAVEEFQRVA